VGQPTDIERGVINKGIERDVINKGIVDSKHRQKQKLVEKISRSFKQTNLDLEKQAKEDLKQQRKLLNQLVSQHWSSDQHRYIYIRYYLRFYSMWGGESTIDDDQLFWAVVEEEERYQAYEKEKITTQRQLTQRQSSKLTPQTSSVVPQPAQTSSVVPQPDGMVRLPSIEVFSEPNTSSKKQALLSYRTVIFRIITKKKISGSWWYEIEYTDDSDSNKFVKGWSLGEGIAEIAWPKTFRLSSPGGSGLTDPFGELREAVNDKPVEDKVARSINLMNVFLLPDESLTLSDFVEEAFYHALVNAKGNFKEACLILTASFRAFKPDTKDGQFRWVQQVKSKNFNYGKYADKLWHFFWNAYRRLDGTGAWTLDKFGLAYELKTRPKPFRSFFTFKALDRDSNEDIVFNRGGIGFAEWINKNNVEVTKSYVVAMRDRFLMEIEKDAAFRNLSEDEKARIIQKFMQTKASQDELQKLTYREFARAAVGILDNVVKAVGEIK
jgi:hypothetical protein